MTQAAVTIRSRRSVLETGVLIGVGLLIIAVYASFSRPMWIDEYAHFALGGLSPGEAMSTIVATTGTGINQGHTGVYLLMDYWLLQVFGANLVALRLPSLLSTALLLFSAVMFMRAKGFGFAWQLVMLVAFAGQASVLYYTGEARPYMPLAAACVATLAYYAIPLTQRSRWIPRCIGILGIIGGAVSHPYFAVMGLAIAVFSLWEAGLLNHIRRQRREIVRFLNPWLVLPAVYLYILVGVLSWAKGRPNNPVDPWFWFGSASNAAQSFVTTNWELFVPAWAPSAWAVSLAFVGLVIIVVLSGWSRARGPIVLAAVSVGSSLVLVGASVAGAYWVFMRQWISGAALVTVAMVWLLATAWADGRDRPGRRAVVLGLVVMVCLSAASGLSFTLGRNDEYRQEWAAIARAPSIPKVTVADAPDNDDWVLLGNLNVAEGGPVWRSAAEYYLRWMKERPAS